MKKELSKKQRKCCSGGRGGGGQRSGPYHPHFGVDLDYSQAKENLTQSIADTQNLLKHLRELKAAYRTDKNWQ